ncbi:MAG: hypothetical protein JSV32_04490, partial [Dehalococcoidia bacterium]
ASEGGILASNDDKIIVEIPGGALPGDTKITVRELAEEDWSEDIRALGPLSHVYRLEPDGLELIQPAKITIRMDPEELAGLELENGCPAFFGFTRSSDGVCDPLLNLNVEIQVDTGTVLVSGETDHFSEAFADAVPELGLRMDLNPKVTSEVEGIPWSAELIVENTNSLEPIGVYAIGYFAFPYTTIRHLTSVKKLGNSISPGEKLVFEPRYECVCSEGVKKGTFGADAVIYFPLGLFEKLANSGHKKASYYQSIVNYLKKYNEKWYSYVLKKSGSATCEALAVSGVEQLAPILSKVYHVIKKSGSYSQQEGIASFSWEFRDDDGFTPSTEKIVWITPTQLPNKFRERYDSGDAIVNKEQIKKVGDNLNIPFDDQGRINFSLRTRVPGTYAFRIGGILKENYEVEESYSGDGDELVVEVERKCLEDPGENQIGT